MPVTLDEARALLGEWVANPGLRRHCATVGRVMARAAERHGQSPGDTPERWEIAGLLHDADYERWPDEHPARVVAWLRERGEPEIAHAVAAHGWEWGVPHVSPLDKALIACDELTGFLVACALPRPDGVLTLEPPAVLKKFKDKRFAANVHRDEVRRAVELLGVDFEDHVAFLIEALRPHAVEFGLAGSGSGPRPA